MSSLRKATEEDLRAALEAFRKDSFGDVNLFANRIMANAVFDTDTTLFLPGFFLKDAALIFGALKTREKAISYSTAKSHGFKFVEFLQKSLSSSITEEQLWKKFHGFLDIIRKFEMSEFEKASYSDNPEFTKKAFSWLFDYLKKNTEILFDKNNLLLKGILNEMSRIFRVHSGGLSEIVLMSLVKALDRYYEYIRKIYERPNNLIDEERVKRDVLPYIDQIKKVYRSELKLSEADSILWNLVRGWREFFIQRMELFTPTVRFERGIEMPEELKKKLSESVTKALEKKI